MDILTALKQERERLQRQLKGLEGAIVALNGSNLSASRTQVSYHKRVNQKRRMSVAGRAKISKLTKARWAKFRAEKLRKAK
jgi:hypothetical protein